MTTEKTPVRTERTRLATAGARAVVESTLRSKSPMGKIKNQLFLALMLLAIATAVTMLLGMILWAAIKGWPRLDLNLFLNAPSTINKDTAGFRPAILGTIYIIVGVIVLIVPIGVAAAVYLEEYADKTKWFNRLIELNIQNLAGVPSIVFGILGMAFIVRGPISMGFVAAAGSITLAMLVLPTVIITAREAIKAVPSSISDASLGLGATQWQTVSKQVLPIAIPGILTGVILAVARAIGEAAPLLLVGATTFVTFNPSLFEGGYTAMPVLIYNYIARPQEEFHILAAAGVIVMLAVLLAMNGFAIWLRNHYERKF
ncbi:MAG: phosphate ABC transporter permease PstA [Mycobacterium sp.]|nr:phosphate ABC transporter permease PstA [Mycobacterium sp.]